MLQSGKEKARVLISTKQNKLKEKAKNSEWKKRGRKENRKMKENKT